MDVKAVLAEFHIEVVRTRGINLDSCCPFHKDSSPSFSIRSDDGKWLCRSGCGAGDLVSLIKRLVGCSSEEAKRRFDLICDPHEELKRKLADVRDRQHYDPEDHAPVRVRTPRGAKDLNVMDPVLGTPFLNYWCSRGLTLELANILNVKYCETGPYANRLIIPVSLAHEQVGFVARSIDRNEEKRFLNSTGTQFTQLLFGYDKAKDHTAFVEHEVGTRLIIVCESVFDCLTLMQWNYPAVATFGAKISYHQISLLTDLKPQKVVIAFHNDEAGIKGAMSKLGILSKIFDVAVLRLPLGKDINEMTEAEFVECLLSPQHKPLHVDKLKESIKWKMQKFLKSPLAP